MTVGELKQKLEDYGDHLPVIVALEDYDEEGKFEPHLEPASFDGAPCVNVVPDNKVGDA